MWTVNVNVKDKTEVEYLSELSQVYLSILLCPISKMSKPTTWSTLLRLLH